MSAYILDENATIKCSHSGTAQASGTESRVKCGGKAVATKSSSYSISGCTHFIAQKYNPCTSATYTTSANRVKAGGIPVLLKDSNATTSPNGSSLTVYDTQMRVKAS